jgi:ankyrin repeat protein
MDSLIDKTTRKKLADALETLPKGLHALDEAYGKNIERIRNQRPNFRRLAKSILLWLTCAKRLLTTLELRHALAVKPGELTFDQTDLESTSVMLYVCAGLVTVDEESHVIRLLHDTTREYLETQMFRLISLEDPITLEDPTMFIRLLHDTTREYLETHMFRLIPREDPTIPKNPTIFDAQKNVVAMADAQKFVTIICVTYLSFDVFGKFCRTDDEFEERLRLYPLYDYAARNWGHHARAASVEEQLVLCFLEDKDKVSASGQALMASAGYSQNLPQQITGVHLAAYFGLRGAMLALLQNGHNPDIKDTYGQTPLSWAAENGNKAAVELLLENGASPDSKDVNSRTPLHLAAEKGREAVVELLLKNGVDVDSKDANGWTPLHLAAKNGHKAVVQLLLDNKAGINTQTSGWKDASGWTALQLATKNGHETVVRLLKNGGAEIRNAVGPVAFVPYPSPRQNIKRTDIVRNFDQHLSKSNSHNRIALVGLGGVG